MSVTVPVLHPSPPSFLYTSLAIDSPVQRVPGTPCYGQSPPILSTVIVESSRRTVPSPAAARVPEIEPSLLRQVLKGPHRKRTPEFSPPVSSKRSRDVPASATPTTPGTQEQVVPSSTEKPGKTDKSKSSSCRRRLPTKSKEGTKILDLFIDSEIFASREE